MQYKNGRLIQKGDIAINVTTGEKVVITKTDDKGINVRAHTSRKKTKHAASDLLRLEDVTFSAPTFSN